MGELASAARKNSRSVDYATHMQARALRLVELRTLYQLSGEDAKAQIAETMRELITAQQIAPAEHTPPEKQTPRKSPSSTTTSHATNLMIAFANELGEGANASAEE